MACIYPPGIRTRRHGPCRGQGCPRCYGTGRLSVHRKPRPVKGVRCFYCVGCYDLGVHAIVNGQRYYNTVDTRAMFAGHPIPYVACHACNQDPPTACRTCGNVFELCFCKE